MDVVAFCPFFADLSAMLGAFETKRKSRHISGLETVSHLHNQPNHLQN